MAFSTSAGTKRTFSLLTKASCLAICCAAFSVITPAPTFAQSTATESTSEAKTDEPIQVPMRIGRRASPFGHYLAARHAEVAKDNTVAADLLAVTLSRYPNSDGLQDARLSLLAAEGRMDEASILADAILAETADNRDALRVKFFTLAKAEDWSAAENLFDGLEAEHFDQVLIPLLNSWAAVAAGKPEDAIDLIEPLKQFQGLEILVRLQTALIHDVSGNYEDATEFYEDSLKLVGAPTLRLADLLGNFYERQGDIGKATKIYDDLIDGNKFEALALSGQQRILTGLTPDKLVSNEREGLAEILYHLGGILFSERGDRLSITLGNTALYLDPTNQFYRLQSGRMIEDQKRYDMALGLYQAIPKSSDLYVRSRLLAIDVMFEQKRWEDAEVILKELKELPGQRFASLTRLGDMYRIQENYADAAVVYDDAIATVDDPQDLSWFNYYYAGIANEQAKNWDKAESLFKTALELEPDQPLVLNYLAYSWVEKGLNLDQSLEMLKTAVSKRPEDGYIIDSLGWVLYKLGKFEEAVLELERAVALRPGDPVINDHLGDAYFRIGRKREAEFQWRRSLSFKPDDKLKSAILEKLETGVVIDEVTPKGEDI